VYLTLQLLGFGASLICTCTAPNCLPQFPPIHEYPASEITAFPIPFGWGQGYPQRRVMVSPCTSTVGSAEQSVLFWIISTELTRLAADRMAPSRDSSLAIRASALMESNHLRNHLDTHIPSQGRSRNAAMMPTESMSPSSAMADSVGTDRGAPPSQVPPPELEPTTVAPALPQIAGVAGITLP